MNLLRALWTLRARALGRAVRDQAATVFLLGPLMLGTGLLLVLRVAHDLGSRGNPARWEPWLWAAAGLAALFAARPPAPGAGWVPPGLALPAGVRWADRCLTGLVRLSPVAAVLAVAVAALGGGAPRWAGVAAVALLAGLFSGMPLPFGRSRRRARFAETRRAALRGAVGLATAALPTAFRPLVAQDLLLVGRGFSVRAGVSAALAAVALLAVAERALADPAGGRVGLLGVTVAAWALASTVFVLWERQAPALWFLAQAGCPPAVLWRAKVATAALLGLLAGLCGALPWAGVAAAVAVKCPLLGLAVGAGVGAMAMEGEARPLLAGVAALIVALGLGALVVLHAGFALAVVPLVAYMERLAVPRVQRHLGETARGL